MDGKGPLHLALVEGYIAIVKTIIKFNPDLEMEVGDMNLG